MHSSEPTQQRPPTFRILAAREYRRICAENETQLDLTVFQRLYFIRWMFTTLRLSEYPERTEAAQRFRETAWVVGA